MVVQDWDTHRNMAFKERMNNLTEAEHQLFYSLPESEQEALLLLKDQTVDWNRRYRAGYTLPSEILVIVAAGYTHPMQNIPKIILSERGL